MPCTVLLSQQPEPDTSVKPHVLKEKKQVSDTDFNYDEIFRDFSDFMDSILSPRSYFLMSLSLGKGNYEFTNKSNVFLETSKRFSYLPTLGYFHKSGLGLAASAYIVSNEKKLNYYQFSLTGSYDYLEDRNLATGLSYSRYFSKDSLPFYTSPLQNELNAYFTYRKWWIRPTLTLNYGWGSRSAYSERRAFIQSLRLRYRGYIFINTTETINDFSIMASAHHDFYWPGVFSYKDYVRLTPQLSFISGTQKFGFNQSSGLYVQSVKTGTNLLYNAENAYLDNHLNFQPLSVSFYLRGEYSIGKFFIQPQLILDYYLPSVSDNFNVLGSVNTGFLF